VKRLEHHVIILADGANRDFGLMIFSPSSALPYFQNKEAQGPGYIEKVALFFILN
jgi:hypothetical protein